MNKQKGIVMGVLALAVTMMVGYAIFSETITITGTATAKGEFNMEITSASITNEVGSKGATASIIDGGNKLSIEVPHLEYPGAYVDVTYNVKNSGTIPAVFQSYNITGETDRIKANIRFNNYFYDVSDIRSETVRIYWDKNNNTEAEETVKITIGMNFIQSENKNSACTVLSERSEWLTRCELEYFDDCYEHLEYDFDHDGTITSIDSTIIDDFIYNMDCPSN